MPSTTLEITAIVEPPPPDLDVINTPSLLSSPPTTGLVSSNTVDNSTPLPGVSIHYLVTVTNSGSNLASGTQVTDLVPDGVSFVEATAGQGTYDDQTGLWMVGDVAPGASATLEITAIVNSFPSGYAVTNTATITSADQADPNADNNTANAVFTLPAVPQPALVSGRVFNDLNADGVQGPGEEGLAGWTIDVFDMQGLKVASTSTLADEPTTPADESGLYAFNLPAGTYVVKEEEPPGWQQSLPLGSSAAYMITVASGQILDQEDFGNYRSTTVTLASGQIDTGQDFGNFQTITISGEKFNDLTGSGSFLPGDPGLPGWTIDLLDASGNIVATSVTDANGDYSFTDVGPGSYTAREEPQPGWIQTFPAAPGSYTVTTSSGSDDTGLNFGNFHYVNVSGNVYDDLNSNGNLDPGEPGLPGWTVILEDQSGNLVATTVSDANGNYEFDNLLPGTFIVEEVLQSGWIQTQPVNLNDYSFVTQSGQIEAGLNFGNFQSPLAINSIAAVSPDPRNTTVSSIDVTFNEPVNPATFTDSAVTLTDNGGPNLITGAATITQVSGSTYQIGGLAALTQSNGQYTLTVNAADIDDESGNPGSGTNSTSWLMDTTPPTSSVQARCRPAAPASASPSRSPAPTVATRPRASPRMTSTSRSTAAPGRSGRPSRPPTPRPPTPARATRPTPSTASPRQRRQHREQETEPSRPAPTCPISPRRSPRSTAPRGPIPPRSTPTTGTFTLNITGNDPGGGIVADFEVFVSVDSGPYTMVNGTAIPAGPPNSQGNTSRDDPLPGPDRRQQHHLSSSTASASTARATCSRRPRLRT